MAQSEALNLEATFITSRTAGTGGQHAARGEGAPLDVLLACQGDASLNRHPPHVHPGWSPGRWPSDRPALPPAPGLSLSLGSWPWSCRGVLILYARSALYRQQKRGVVINGQHLKQCSRPWLPIRTFWELLNIPMPRPLPGPVGI